MSAAVWQSYRIKSPDQPGGPTSEEWNELMRICSSNSLAEASAGVALCERLAAEGKVEKVLPADDAS